MEMTPVTQLRPLTEDLLRHFANIASTKDSLQRLRRVEAFIGWTEEVEEAIAQLDRLEAKLQDVIVDRLGREGVRKLILDEYLSR